MTRGAGVLLYIDFNRETLPLTTAAFHWSSGAKVVPEVELEAWPTELQSAMIASTKKAVPD